MSNPFNSVYTNHLPIIKTPRSNEPRMRGIVPRTRLPSFSNFIRPIIDRATAQPMHIDHPVENVNNPENDSHSNDIQKSPVTHMTPSTLQHQSVSLTVPSSSPTFVSPSTPSPSHLTNENEHLTVTPMQHVLPATGHPPEVSPSHGLAVRTMVKKSKKKMRDTLKKALETALSMRNKPSGDAPAQSHSVDGTPEARGAPSGTIEDSEDGLGSSQHRRIFREAARIARDAERAARALGNRPRQEVAKKVEPPPPVVPQDPHLAASLDAMALQHAKGFDDSSTTPLVNKFTGKRHRDTDHTIPGPDPSSSGFAGFAEGGVANLPEDRRDALTVPEHPMDNASSVNHGKDVTGNIPDSSDDNVTKKLSGNSVHVSYVASEIGSGNELDFLATVVLLQENQIDQKEMTTDNNKEKNVSPGSSSDGVATQEDADTPHCASASQTMSARRLLAPEVNVVQVTPPGTSQIMSSQEDHDMDQEAIGDGSTSGTEGENNLDAMVTNEVVPPGTDTEQDIEPAPSDVMEEEPKSESSFVHEPVPESNPQETPDQTISHSPDPTMTEERDMQVEENVVNDDPPASPREESSKTSPVGASSSQSLRSLLARTTRKGKKRETKVSEDEDEITPAPKAIREVQKVLFLPVQTVTKKLKRSKQAASVTVNDEDEITPAHDPCPKHPTRGPKYQEVDEITPALQETESQSELPSTTPTRPLEVRNTTYEDVSEISPAPPRPPKYGAYRAGPYFQGNTLSPGAGSSAQGGAQGATGSSNSDDEDIPAKKPLPYTFCCDTCGAMFNRRFNLNKHIRNVHQNIRNFKCTLCEERFLQKSHRTAHLLAVHHKIRPFACHMCPKNFSWLGVLRKHLQAIHKVTVKTTKRSKRTMAATTETTTTHPQCGSAEQHHASSIEQQSPPSTEQQMPSSNGPSPSSSAEHSPSASSPSKNPSPSDDENQSKN